MSTTIHSTSIEVILAVTSLLIHLGLSHSVCIDWEGMVVHVPNITPTEQNAILHSLASYERDQYSMQLIPSV